MVVLFGGAGLTVVATLLVALRQARQEQRFEALSAHLLSADPSRTE